MAQENTGALVDPAALRASAEAMRGHGFEIVAQQLEEAAGEIEGGLEAFGVVVDQKRELEVQLKHSQQNHRHTLDMIAQWGDLLRELKNARPLTLYGEEWITRIRRALCEIA
jgi:hypothetical protein